jgi:hypothetical protein
MQSLICLFCDWSKNQIEERAVIGSGAFGTVYKVGGILVT